MVLVEMESYRVQGCSTCQAMLCEAAGRRVGLMTI